MCLITLSWLPSAKTPLIVAANRDEFYARPASALKRWPEQPILAGKDEKAGGAWLGIGWTQLSSAQTFRFAALTNYRARSGHNPNAPSRGHITTAFLSGNLSSAAYLKMLSETNALYNPFNLIVFDGHELLGFESRHQRAFALPVGISAVSNADFNTPWPKLLRLRDGFAQVVRLPAADAELDKNLFHLLSNEQVANDAELPQTGLSLNRERTLSAAFIRTPDYGTRASSVLRLSSKAAFFAERSFDAGGLTGEVSQHISLD